MAQKSTARSLLAALFPGLTALVLLYIIAIWAIWAVFTGVLEVIAAVRLRRAMSNEWGLIIGGILCVLFGIVLIVSPGAGALAVVFLIGAYAVLFGITLLMLSWLARPRARWPAESRPAVCRFARCSPIRLRSRAR
jgi:uncharacterized membrane protein HdeD (DUF308 family)